MVYFVLFVYFGKSSCFPQSNSKWQEKLIVCLIIFNLKQGNFQAFQKNPKSETVIPVAYGTELISSLLLLCFIQHVSLYFVYIYCHILLTNLRQQAFFINFSNSYQILGLMLPDKQFFYFVSFLILLLFIIRLFVYKFP